MQGARRLVAHIATVGVAARRPSENGRNHVAYLNGAPSWIRARKRNNFLPPSEGDRAHPISEFPRTLSKER